MIRREATLKHVKRHGGIKKITNLRKTRLQNSNNVGLRTVWSVLAENGKVRPRWAHWKASAYGYVTWRYIHKQAIAPWQKANGLSVLQVVIRSRKAKQDGYRRSVYSTRNLRAENMGA